MLLLDVPLLAIWTREDIEPTNPFAVEVIRVCSELVLDHCDLNDDTFAALTDKDKRTLRRVALLVAKRSWLNPDHVVREGSIGPIGGDSYADIAAAGAYLTDLETDALDTVVTGAPDSGALWTQPTTMGGRTGAPMVYLADERGYPADLIPYGAPDDIGAFVNPETLT